MEVQGNEADSTDRRSEDGLLSKYKLKNSRLVMVLKWLVAEPGPTHIAWLLKNKTPIFTGQGNIPKTCLKKNVGTIANNLQVRF